MASESVLQGAIEVKGVKFDVTINGTGTFYAELDSIMYQAETLAELRKKILVAVQRKSKNVSIPVTVLKAGYTTGYRSSVKGELIDAEVTGVHEGSRNLIIRYTDKDGKQSSHQTSYGYTVFRRLNAGEKQMYEANVQQREQLDNRIREFENSALFDREAVKKELMKQLGLEEEGLDFEVNV